MCKCANPSFAAVTLSLQPQIPICGQEFRCGGGEKGSPKQTHTQIDLIARHVPIFWRAIEEMSEICVQSGMNFFVVLKKEFDHYIFYTTNMIMIR